MAMPHPPDLSPPNAPGPRTPRTGLEFGVCETLAQVEACQALVYRAYRRAGLIPPDRRRRFTHRHGVSPHACTIQGRVAGQVACTVTACLDSPMGLPLDAVYPDQLGALRDAGRPLTEIGLFADRRRDPRRSIDALLEVMRFACHFGITHGATDGVIGVHPHHAAFYIRLLGFEIIGPQRAYSAVNNNPVVLLRLDWPRQTAATPLSPRLPRGLRYFADHPLTRADFADRYRFPPPPIPAPVPTPAIPGPPGLGLRAAG